MGNALVVGLIEIMGKRIEEIEKADSPRSTNGTIPKLILMYQLFLFMLKYW